MTSTSTRLLAAVLVLSGSGVIARVHAQPAQNGDVLSQLLVEVHALRVAMEQAATTGPRVQLLTGRLQIEEGRINNMVRRLDAVQEAETSAAKEVGDLQAQWDRFDSAAGNADLPPEERTQLEHMKPEVKRHLAQAQAALDARKTEDAQLQSDIASEQARWSAISQQLDALDRELSKR